jgi:MoaA/NifB/PqqE/SkfB family radical SAM enzyme
MDVRKRLDLKLGFSCNNNCLSCPQAHNRALGDNTLENIKKSLDLGISQGADEVVLTGGEPTIRSDILEIVRYARSVGYDDIQLQTNGRMLYYMPFAKKLVAAGITEFSPALHGHTAGIHDYITSFKGAFDQVVQGIKNLKSLGQYVITNSVITKINYKHLKDLGQLLIDLDVDQFQLAFIHPVGNAWKNSGFLVPRKSDVKCNVHETIDLAVKNRKSIMVEAYPFCFMGGYERYCSELYMPPSDMIDSKIVVKNFDEMRKTSGKVKFRKCKRCRFERVCEGPWKEYVEIYGSSEFVPVNGKKISDKSQIINHV